MCGIRWPTVNETRHLYSCMRMSLTEAQEWISADGQVDGVASFSETSPSNQRIALRSFVSKQAGDQVLAEAVSDFRSELQRNARARKCLSLTRAWSEPAGGQRH